MCLSLSEEDQPQQACEKNDDAWVKEGYWSDLRFQPIAQQYNPQSACKNYGNRQAYHPDREKRSQDVD
jgi:hypothetical protein